MKKFIVIALALVMVLTLAACGSKQPTGYKFLDEQLGVETYGIAFRKGDTALKDQVEAGLKAIVKNGTFAKIADKEDYADIKPYLCLSPDDFSDAECAVQGSGDPNFTFKHGFDLDYPPYSGLKDDGSVGGFDVEVCQAVCEYLGWKYEPVPFNWDAKDAELNAGSCDCIWSGITVEGREDDYTWGMVYSNNTQMIMVPDTSKIKSLADLKGKKVGVQTSTSAYDMLEDSQAELAATFSDLLVYESYTIAFNDLKAGAIDAIAIDVTTGTYLMNNDKNK